MFANIKRARSEAKKIVTEYGFPINLEKLAAQNNLEIVRKDMREDISGIFQPAETGGVIFINSSHAETRQKFSLAHEIAHYRLKHCDGLHVDKIYRNNDSSKAIDPKEIEANNFAAELLMPALIMEQKFQDCIKSGNTNLDSVSKKLSEIFGVSNQAIRIRLESLGFSETLE